MYLNSCLVAAACFGMKLRSLCLLPTIHIAVKSLHTLLRDFSIAFCIFRQAVSGIYPGLLGVSKSFKITSRMLAINCENFCKKLFCFRTKNDWFQIFLFYVYDTFPANILKAQVLTRHHRTVHPGFNSFFKQGLRKHSKMPGLRTI